MPNTKILATIASGLAIFTNGIYKPLHFGQKWKHYYSFFEELSREKRLFQNKADHYTIIKLPNDELRFSKFADNIEGIRVKYRYDMEVIINRTITEFEAASRH